MKPNLIFGLVLDRLAGLKLSVILLKYPTFEGVFSIIFWENRKNQKALLKLTDL